MNSNSAAEPGWRGVFKASMIVVASLLKNIAVVAHGNQEINRRGDTPYQ